MLIQAQNVGSVSAVNFTSGISSAIANYYILFDSVVCPAATTDAYLMVQVSDDGGSTYKSTDYLNYLGGGITSGLACGLMYDGGGALPFTASGRIDLLNMPFGTTELSSEGIATFFNVGILYVGGQMHNGMYKGSPLMVDAIRLLSSDGNVISGNFYLYSY